MSKKKTPALRLLDGDGNGRRVRLRKPAGIGARAPDLRLVASNGGGPAREAAQATLEENPSGAAPPMPRPLRAGLRRRPFNSGLSRAFSEPSVCSRPGRGPLAALLLILAVAGLLVLYGG